jgi:hypothetical protein
MQVTVKRMYAPQQPLHFDFSGGGSTTVATLLNKIHDRLGWCLADLRLLRGGSNVQPSHVIDTASTEFVLVLKASWRKRAADKGIAMGKNNETFSGSSMNDYQKEVEKHRKRFVEEREAAAAQAAAAQAAADTTADCNGFFYQSLKDVGITEDDFKGMLSDPQIRSALGAEVVGRLSEGYQRFLN